MRRILVERARRRNRLRHGRGLARIPLDNADISIERAPDILALDEAIDRLQTLHPRQAQIVKLRYFAGLTIAETAEILDISPTTVKSDWSHARAWLHAAIANTDR